MARSAIKRIEHSLAISVTRIDYLFELTTVMTNEEFEEWAEISDSRSCFKKSDLIMNFLGKVYGLSTAEIRFSPYQKSIEARRFMFILHVAVLGMTPQEVSKKFGYPSCSYHNKLVREFSESLGVSQIFVMFYIRLAEVLIEMTSRISD